MRITRDRILQVLGPAPKPERVWEKQFDYFDAELARMAQLDWDRVPDSDMWYYLLDLAYQELQPNLFRHLFPACLKFWHETLMRNVDAAYGDSEFHYAMMQGQVLDKMLTDEERQRVYALFHDGLLDRIEAERGLANDSAKSATSNAWIWRFNSLGIVAPVIPAIWNDWWRLDHPGKTFCAVMYASGLVYLEDENPIYGPWKPKCGGGGPNLTANDSSIFHWAWRRDNLAFLRETLTLDYVLTKLDQAAAVLADSPEAEMARKVALDAKSRTDIIEIRIGDVIENLGRLEMQKARWE